MERRTIWRVVRHPRQHLQLWAVTEGSPFHCRIWEINHAQWQAWHAWQKASVLNPSSPHPDFLSECFAETYVANVWAACDFFATDFSAVLRWNAERMFHRLDPQHFHPAPVSPRTSE